MLHNKNKGGLWVRKLDVNRGKLAQIDFGERICSAKQRSGANKQANEQQ